MQNTTARRFTIQKSTLDAILPVFANDRSAAFAFVQGLGKSDACPRCGGSGHYSFNLLDGTKCYGCNGTGYVGARLTKAEITKLTKVGPDAFVAWTAAQAEKAAVRAAEKAAAWEAEQEAWRAAAEAEKIEAEAAERARVRAEEAAKAAVAAATNWLGEVGSRVEFTATIKKIRSGTKQGYGYYAETWHLTVMETEDGSSVVWWNAFAGHHVFDADGNATDYIEGPSEGDTVKVKATVKAHGWDKYTGAKQTEIQRAKVVR